MEEPAGEEHGGDVSGHGEGELHEVPAKGAGGGVFEGRGHGRNVMWRVL
jgi:hypothetical protein